MQKQIKNFLDFIENDKKASQNTLQSYRRDITQYSNYIEENRINYLKMDEEDIRDYLRHMNEIGKKSSTISRSLASIRSFYQFLLKNKKVKRNPTEGIQSPKIERRIPAVLTSQEVELLLDQPKNIDLKGIRDKAMLEFAYATGMKVTEIISLDIDDINIEEGYVTCKNKDKARNIPLGSLSLKALKDYVENSRNILIKDGRQAPA